MIDASEITPEIYASLIANDQYAFTREVFNIVSAGDTYSENWHVDCIIEHLQAVERGEIRRLVINIPPRCLKSITCAIAWPAWLLGKNPSNRIISASYGSDLAKKHSIDTRLVMESDIYKLAFPNTRIAKGQNEKMMFQTDKMGFRKATSVGGSLTGMGGDFLIMDDPIKPDEARSKTTRDATNDWIDQVFLTRFNNPATARALLIMQRVHEDDPSAHLLEKGNWYSLVLPAEFTHKTIIEVGKKRWERNPGDLLDKNRLSKDVLNTSMKELGAYGFSGQYAQRPAPLGGGEIKVNHFGYYNNYSAKFTPRGMNVYILYDPANSKKKSNDPDYTAIVVVGLASDNNYYVLDLVRDRLNPTERIDKLIELHMKWNELSGKPPKVGAEQYGMMTDIFYLKKAMDDMNYRFKVVELAGRMSKEDRIRRLIPLIESERIFLPKKVIYDTIDGEQKELVKEFISEEAAPFPVGRHDDMLDALARIVDKELHAMFPKIQITIVEKGGKVKDDWRGEYDEDDFTSW